MDVGNARGRTAQTGPFIGRERELVWLEQHVRRAPTKPLVIHGEPGIGKTALLNDFAISSNHTRPSVVWDLPFDPREAQTLLRVNVGALLEQRQTPRAVIVDEADSLAPSEIIDLTERLTSRKMIDAVIFSRREPIEKELTAGQLHLKGLSASEARDFALQVLGLALSLEEHDLLLEATHGNPMALSLIGGLVAGRPREHAQSLIKGRLYGLADSLVVPERRLLEAAKPELIRANDRLIERLQREPKGLYQLTSRKFEEVVADLLEDMDYEVHLTPPSKDGGVDIYAYARLPHTRVLTVIEVKKYRKDRKVQVDLVRQLLGVWDHKKASTAMLVTSSSFTAGARELEEERKHVLSLKDYGDVVRWIDDYGRPGRPRLGRH